MPRQESTTSIRDWIDEETRHIDVVASWESLCDTYDALRFTDQLSDAERLEEYKGIVQQMNAFLSKIKTKLLSCKDMEAMIEMLGASFTPTGKVELSTRRSLVYQKLRQQWIRTTVMKLQTMRMEEQDG
jgi:hypothetical protein